MRIPFNRVLPGAFAFFIVLDLHASVPLARDYQNKVGERLQQAIAGEQTGVAAILTGRKMVELDRRQTHRLALQQAPQLLANNESRTIAESALTRQTAEFDWILGASASYTQTSFNARSEEIRRERVTGITISGDNVGEGEDDGQTDENGAPVAVSDSVGNLLCITVDGEIVNDEQCALLTEVTTEREFASADADSTNAFTLGLTTSKLFEPGSLLTGGIGLSHRTKNFYPLDDVGLISPLSASDPIGNGSRYPWTSRLFVEYLTPLPFGKGYGRYGSPAGLGRELAVINNEQSRHTEHAIQQTLLLQIDDAYWNHVRSALRLQSAENTRANLDSRLASAQRQFNARSLTNYELSQIQSALASARAQEQNAWVAFITSSDALSGLLGMESASVIVPAGFHEELGESQLLDRQDQLDVALENNPGINASRVAIQANDVLVKNAKQNLNADLNVVVGLEFSQSDVVLGYDSAGDSLSNVFDPDNTNWFLGLRYKLPLGRHADKARKQQAEARLTQARNRKTLEEINLVAELNSLVAGNNAALSLTSNAERQLDLANQAFERGTSARNSGSVSEFEFLQILTDLDTARQNWINRLVEQQQIVASLHALQGVLGQTNGAGQ